MLIRTGKASSILIVSTTAVSLAAPAVFTNSGSPVPPQRTHARVGPTIDGNNNECSTLCSPRTGTGTLYSFGVRDPSIKCLVQVFKG
jgi:hypothetical protein